MRLFTSSCVLCDEDVAGAVSLCAPCRADLPTTFNSCSRCGLGLQEELNAMQCGQCQQCPPPIDYLVSALDYSYPVDYLVSQLKFHGKLTHANILSQLLLDKIQSQPFDRPDMIIPVPLHINRLRSRGFNQALEIARPISKALRIPVATQYLKRTKQTHAQSLLKAKERQENMQHSFELVKLLAVQHVVLLDDVVTTGATVYELAKLLRHSGVARIGVWTVARTL